MKLHPSFCPAILIGMLIFCLLSCDKNNPAEDSAQPTTMKDLDGNIYQTVKIGDQTWTQSNLAVSRYRNGDVIPEVRDAAQWISLTTGAWCYYANDPANGAVYGKLYNWYAVADPRGLSPQGWHIPSGTEFTTLITSLGGQNTAGGSLKEAGTLHWLNPNTGAANNSGFTALPAGYRCSCSSGAFYNIGNQALWWSSTSGATTTGSNMEVAHNNIIAVISVNDKRKGYSIRCIQD